MPAISNTPGTRRRATRLALVISAVVLAMQGCSDGSDGPIGPAGALPRAGVTVVNDQSALETRVNHQRTTVPLSRNGVSSQSVQALGDPGGTSFIHVASVAPPEIEGNSLPATHIITRGTLAYVSYASISQSRFGAVDVFDVSNPAYPKLVSSALFSGTKVFSLALDATGSTLYLGTSTSDSGFATPAVVEAMPLDHGKLSGKSIRQSVNSYAVTGVSVQGKDVWATSGNGGELAQGGVFVLDASTLQPKFKDLFDDARAVGGNGDQMIVASGMPGTLRVYNPDYSLRVKFQAGGLSVPDSKATVAVSGYWGFLSLGSDGVAAYRIKGSPNTCVNPGDPGCGTATGLVAKLPGPTAPLGMDPAYAVTNAVAPVNVTNHDALVFTADGGAGIRVWYSNYPGTSQSGTPKFIYLGALVPSAALPGSSNMVGATSTSLLAANGEGGLRIFYFSWF